MKSTMRFISALLLAMLSLSMVAGAATVLVSPGSPGDGGSSNPAVRNGGFESATPANGQTAAEVDDWFGYAGDQTRNIRTTPGRTGTWAGITSSVAKPIVGTGHTIAKGDQYDLLFWYRRSATTGVPTMSWVLCYYADEGTPGFDPLTALVTDLFTAGTSSALGDAWQQEVVSKTVDGSHSAAFGKTLYLRFSGTVAGNPVSQGRFDDVVLKVTSALEDFGPANEAVNVPVTGTTLSWILNTAAVDPNVAKNPQYHVYFSKDRSKVDPADPNDVSGRVSIQTGTVYPATGFLALEYSSAITPEPYYWKVVLFDGTSGAKVYTGPVLQFLTQANTPVFTLQPKSLTVKGDGTESALFTVQTDYAVTFSWYKEGNPTPLKVADVTQPGHNELLVANATAGGEGAYYCVISNGTESVTSNSARLWTHRMFRWKLDGSLAESQDGVYNGQLSSGIPVGGPHFAAGVDGQALNLAADPNYVLIPDSQTYFNFYPLGFTASAWVSTPALGAPGTPLIAAKWDSAASAGWQLGYNQNSNVFLNIGPSTTGASVLTGVVVADNTWHHLALTYTSAGTAGVYVDGVLQREYNYPLQEAGNSAQLQFLGSTYPGMIDDVRIYTYPLDIYGIAQLYIDFKPGTWVCLTRPSLDISGPAGVPDCKVDIHDFVRLVEQWLACGRYPASACN